MFRWRTDLHTLRPLPALPRLTQVASERQDSPAYHHEGRYRQREQHCLFKYSLRGCGIFRDARGEHPVPAGSGFLCVISDPETAYYYPRDGAEPWIFVYGCVRGGNAIELTRELVARYGPVFRLAEDEEPVRLLLDQRRGEDAGVESSLGESAALAMRLFGGLADAGERREPASGSLLVRRVRALLREQEDANLNVAEVAESLRVSREHLTRVFASQTGVTPYRYITRQRMLRACRLLKETNLTSTEIAAQLGFDAPGHFARTFRRVIGMPPQRFRKVGSVPFR